jgi:6-pyruvoyl tetrahydropterin synthase
MTVLSHRRESFNAAHQRCDPDLSDEENRRLSGKCANLHGHNYVLEVAAAGEIDPATGYVPDLKLLPDVISRQILRDGDHRKPGLPGGVVPDGETRDQQLTITPYPRPGRHTTWEPYRQTIETTDGVLAAERRDPAPHPGDPRLVAS